MVTVLRQSVYRVCEAHLHIIGPAATQPPLPFEEMLRRWQAVDNTKSDLTGLRVELQTSRYRD